MYLFGCGSVYACDFPWRLVFFVCVCVCGGCLSISNLRYEECGLALDFAVGGGKQFHCGIRRSFSWKMVLRCYV